MSIWHHYYFIIKSRDINISACYCIHSYLYYQEYNTGREYRMPYIRTMWQMYVESHTHFECWSSANHNTATRNHLVLVFVVNVVSWMWMKNNKAGQDNDNRDPYSAVELIQWFTKTANKLVTSKKLVPTWKQYSAGKAKCSQSAANTLTYSRYSKDTSCSCGSLIQHNASSYLLTCCNLVSFICSQFELNPNQGDHVCYARSHITFHTHIVHSIYRYMRHSILSLPIIIYSWYYINLHSINKDAKQLQLASCQEYIDCKGTGCAYANSPKETRMETFRYLCHEKKCQKTLLLWLASLRVCVCVCYEHLNPHPRT